LLQLQRAYDPPAREVASSSYDSEGTLDRDRAIEADGITGEGVLEGSVKENPTGESKKLLAPEGPADILSAYTGQFGNLSWSTEGKGLC
jgi:hypothetical protein